MIYQGMRVTRDGISRGKDKAKVYVSLSLIVKILVSLVVTLFLLGISIFFERDKLKIRSEEPNCHP